jgi:molecular chaperone GrpE (heat shock protein)
VTDEDQITEEVAALRQLVEERLANDEVKEKAFDQLYGELKQYKDDFVFQAEKALLLDLLLFYDSLNWFSDSLAKDSPSPDVVADSFQYLIDEFLEVLYRRDVLPFEGSEQFDAKNQKAVKVQDTEVEEDDFKIIEVLKRGFTRGDRALRAEEVVISRYRAPKQE